MLEGYKPLTPEEIENQIKQTSASLDQEIVPPSKREEVMNMSISEIKGKFPLRLKAFLKTRRLNKQGKELSEEEKEEMSDVLRVLNNLDKYIEDHWKNGEKVLRDRQISVFEDIHDFLEEGGKDGYVKLPTGAGKTVIFSEFIEAIGLRTLIVVPTKILVEQTEEKLSQFAEKLDTGKIYSEEKRLGNDVTIITYDSLIRMLDDGAIDPDDYKCLILDEVHVCLTKNRVEAINRFNHAIRLGFTATTQYSWKKKVENILPNEIHNLGVKEAAEEGVVSPFSVILAETNIDISNVKITAEGEYSQEDLNKAINTEGRNNSAVDLYKQLFDGQLGVVYCCGIEHAEEVKNLFIQKGIKAEVISGENSSKEQQEILRRFKAGEIKILCNADILTTGFDEQKASICLNLRPTLSSVMAEQRGGRVLRLDGSNPAKHATIVDFIDKNINNRTHPITFAEIANASVAYPTPAFKDSPFNIREPIKIIRSIKPDIKIEGLNIITDPTEVMRVVNKMKAEDIVYAPEGWFTAGGLVNKLGKALGVGKIARSVSSVTESYRGMNVNWFQPYLDKNGQVKEHFSPELVSLIEKEITSRETAPEGWFTTGGLVNKINNFSERKVNSAIVAKTAGLYQESNPDWFHYYLDTTGRKLLYYSPELVKKIEEEIGLKKIAPGGWLTNKGLATKLDRGNIRKGLARIAAKYKGSNPDWFRNFLDRSGKNREHYSPELIEKIKADLNK